MKAEFWHECWEQGRLGFHQSDFNRHMIEYMPRLGLEAGAHVLVPLCGKSLDMLWLLKQGYAVTGIELSQKAVEDFFAENELDFERREQDGADIYRFDRLEIVCADLFDFSIDLLDPVDAVYDRAALPALPARMRRAYAAWMLGQLPLNTVTLMQAMEYNQNEMDGPPFAVSPAEIEELYGLCCTIEPLLSEPCLDRHPNFRERGLTRLIDHVYTIRKTRETHHAGTH